jgi:lipid II:glycine glycyltransferase (peptidoglycan interpeptide bridge formation enzyme)
MKLNTKLDRIKVCLQGMLQLQQTHLRIKFRHLSPEQKSTRALFLELQPHLVDYKSFFPPKMSALQLPPRVSVQKR